MRSQGRNLRHTIMALVTIASLTGLAPYSALAASITLDFTITTVGTPLRTVMGTFSYDSDDGPIIDDDYPAGPLLELTSLTSTWSGPNPSTFSTDRTTDQVVVFSYATPFATPLTNTLLKLTIVNDAGFVLSCGSSSQPFVSPSCGMGGTLFVSRGENVIPYEIFNSTVGPAAAIPEPSTAILLSLGLVGMILYALARRLRPVAPRRVPVADARR